MMDKSIFESTYPKDLGFLLWSQGQRAVCALVPTRAILSAKIIHRAGGKANEMENNPRRMPLIPVETIFSTTRFRFAMT